MTIEGRPDIQHDWKSSYRKQRRDRLDDALSEFLNDDSETDPKECYEEILASVQDWIDYHKKHMDRWVELKTLMQGHRQVDFDDPVLATKWQYDKVLLSEDQITGTPVVKIGEDPVIFGA